MGYIWNTSTRSPERTNLMGWGKLGTGPSSLSYGNSYALNNFCGLIKFDEKSFGTTGLINALNTGVASTNAAIFGNIGWGVGKEIRNNALKYWQFTISGSNFPTTTRPTWWNEANYEYNTPLLSNINESIIGAGSDHIIVLYGNTLVAFGSNSYGQCNVPSGISTNVKAVDGGLGHSLVLYNSGSMTGWGLTAQGQLNIPAGLTAERIAVGLYHNIALKNDGTVVCWGGNTFSQCDVPAGLTGITAIGAGYYHSMAIRTNGTVVCWGLNTSGQCNVPASVGTGGSQIAGGSGHTALLKKNGSVVCWGDNTYRQSTIPTFPEPDINYSILATSQSAYRQVYSQLAGSCCATKVFCTENATWALTTNKSTIGDLMWSVFEGYVAAQPATALIGYTSSNAVSGNCFYVNLSGYNPQRHDIYTYPYQPTYGQAVMPNGINTAWWINGTTSERKLDACFVSTYQNDGIFKAYDWFSPPDLSGCSCKARQWGAPWINPEGSSESFGSFGYIKTNTSQYGWNNYNSGYWSNILITKKHALASKHYSGPNVNLYGVKWIRRDGQAIVRNLTRISNLTFPYQNAYGGVSYPDMVLYELDQELTQKDLENISIYNILPKLSGMTGSKLIDTKAYLWKGLAGISYGDPTFMSQVGRRIWYLDGQDRVYSKRIAGVTGTYLGDYVTNQFIVVPPRPSIWEPDDVDCNIQVGDSGSPVFITAANWPDKSQSLEDSYFAGQGTTWGRTLFLGLFDAGFGEYGSTFINYLNAILITRGITGNDLLQQIDIDSVGPSLPWTAVVGAPQTYQNDVLPPDYTGLDVNGQFEQQSLSTIGEAIVESWDSDKKIISLSGISGTMSVNGLTSYILQDVNGQFAAYSTMNPYILPINNGLGTTAGSNDVLQSESSGYTFDPNDPFAECATE